MHPARAAWFFAAGLVWLVLRGILARALPLMRADHIAQDGGWLLIIPLISVVASMTAPIFFFSILSDHRFSHRRTMQSVTIIAAFASLLSSVLIFGSFVATARGMSAAEIPIVRSFPWLFQAVPLLLIGSLFLFLVVVARFSDCEAGVRRSAGVAAIGTLVPLVMMVVWALHQRFGGVLDWFPSVSQSLAVRVLGVAAAGALFWFLETFAVSYGEGGGEGDRC